MSRNKELEKKLVNLLQKAVEKDCDNRSRAMAANAMMTLYKATDEKEYADKAKQMVDQFAANAVQKEDTAKASGNEDISSYLWGNLLYYIGDYIKDTKYTDMAIQLAARFDTQQRHRAGFFSSDIEKITLNDFYCTQPFYMNYDTRNGGKEHYNDIIAQYDAVSSLLFEGCKNSSNDYIRPYDLLMQHADKIKEQVHSDKKVYENFVYYAASFIDTMELMAQPLYEIYRKLQEYYKVAVSVLLSSDNQEIESNDTASVMLSYTILKGCRMKALHTEKYEEQAEKRLEEALYSIDAQNPTFDAKYLAAVAFGYSEWIRNREYQDYGRNKGGVLWS